MRRLLDDPLVVVDSSLIVLLLCLDIAQIHIQISEGLEDRLNKDFSLKEIGLCPLYISGLQAEGPVFIVLEASQQVWVCSGLFLHPVLGFSLALVHD